MKFRSFTVLFIIFALIISAAAPALAADGDTVYISDTDGLFALAENCRYDAWSVGKTVYLTRDISLGGVEFTPIASFGGTFEGNGHTVSGLSVTADVSPSGLFGTVEKTGVVRNLTVSGTVTPGGSGEAAGGIAGRNRGTISGCTFSGTVSGERSVGGIVGVNAESGAVTDCSVSGGVSGKNMTGGAVGTNHGLVASCENQAYVNTGSADPSLSFDNLNHDLTGGLSSLISPETYNIIVDSGGIAGFSDGTVIDCRNDGSVGYQHIGYNVGGIAGRSSGHVASCKNVGSVYGRREVGGIVGMAEPYVILDLKEDNLEQVRQELNTLGSLIDKAEKDAANMSSSISARMSSVRRSVRDAETHVKTLGGEIKEYVGDAVTEVNRAGGILSAVINQLSGVSDGLTDASASLKQALDALNDAAKSAEDSGVSDELSKMAEDLKSAADSVSKSSEAIRQGLNKISGAAGLSDGDSKAIQTIMDGAADAAMGFGELTEVITELKAGIADGTINDSDSLIAFLNDNQSRIENAKKRISDGLKAIDEGMKAISVDQAEVREGCEQIRSGIESLSGVTDSIFDAIDRLEKAAQAGDIPLDKLKTVTEYFSDATADLNDELRRTKNLLDYLSRQDELNIRPVSDKAETAAGSLSDSMKDISDQLDLLNTETKSASDTLLGDMRKINRQFISLMNMLLDVVEDVKGASSTSIIEDTSDEDVDAVVAGKVLDCVNTGSVSADIDAGGVAGAMMIYNELDPERDFDNLSSVFQRRYQLKCVLQSCTNSGTVTAKRDNAGSVCGSAQLGVISGCNGFGSAESETGDYVGGIAGSADNIIRKCISKSSLAGGKYVGGIVGSGKEDSELLKVNDCRALPEITRCSQYGGAISGGEYGDFSNNTFVSRTLAGIGGMSVQGKAEPVEYDELIADKDVPKELRSFTLTFVAVGRTVAVRRFRYGDTIDDSDFPKIPEIDGQFGRWDAEKLENLQFDTTVTAVYSPTLTALSSTSKRSAGRPAFLLEGAFDDTAELDASPALYDFRLDHNSIIDLVRACRRTVQEQWLLTLPEGGGTVRYLPPEGISGKLELYSLSDGRWHKLTTDKIGSYYTFGANADEIGLSVVSVAAPWWAVTLAVVFLIGAAILIAEILLHRSRKPAVTDEEKRAARQRQRRRKRLRLILLSVVLALGLAVAAVIRFAPRISEGLSLYRLLRNYEERSELDMSLTLSGSLDGRDFHTDADLYATDWDGKRVSCLTWQEIPIWFCNNTVIFENGKSYKSIDFIADYSTLLSQFTAFYRTADVTSAEENGVTVYHASASGESASRILDTMMPAASEFFDSTETVELSLIVTDGELTSLDINWNGGAGTLSAELKILDEKRDHTLPQAVRTAIATGTGENAAEPDEHFRTLLTALTDTLSRDPLTAEVTLKANCGPLLVDESLTWQRTFAYGRELSRVSRGGLEIYGTSDAVCTGSGIVLKDGETGSAARLLRLAHKALLLGEPSCTDSGGELWFTLSLDSDGMRELIEAVAPEALNSGIVPQTGALRVECADGRIASVILRTDGAIRIAGIDIKADFSARMDFDGEAQFKAPDGKVLKALGLD